MKSNEAVKYSLTMKTCWVFFGGGGVGAGGMWAKPKLNKSCRGTERFKRKKAISNISGS